MFEGFDPRRWQFSWLSAGEALIALGVAVGIAFIVHVAIFAVLRRAAARSAREFDDALVAALRRPVRWALIAFALSLVAESEVLVGRGWDLVARFAGPAILGWVAFALVDGLATAFKSTIDLTRNPVEQGGRLTRISILARSLKVIIVIIAVSLIMLAVPGVRDVGTTILASAGLATLAVGAAAQPALKSLIAGVQIALTEPIRIGDYVVIDKESGRVEDIRLSYVVIRTADERRFIVPTAKFLDGSFQNWTRVGGGITGSVVLPIKPGVPLAPIREAYERLLAAHPEWDRRTGSLQVSEINVGSVEIKLVMSAQGPTALGSLRPAIREDMLEWLRENAPEALCTEV